MKFEEDKTVENIAEKIGFIFSFLFFTAILFLILDFLNKIPESWNFFHIGVITIAILAIGAILKRLLK